MAMPWRMTRLALRPQRKERNAMIFSSQRLPRSRCPTHSAALCSSCRTFAALGFMQRTAGNFAVVDADREVNQSRGRGLVFQHETIARPHGIEKFRGRDMP